MRVLGQSDYCLLTLLPCLGKSPRDVDPCPSFASPGPSAFPGSGSGGERSGVGARLKLGGGGSAGGS